MDKYPQEILGEIKKSLEEQKNKIKKSLHALTSEDPFTDPDRINDNAAVDTEAKEEVDHERIEILKQGLESDIANVDAALGRIEKGTFGFCENCGKMIDTDRLAAVPTARYCMDCEKKLSK